MTNSLNQLMEKLEYQFRDTSLLEAALTHRSIRGNNNERLEFLGDSILNFVIAEALYHIYPHAKEGELSRLRASLVKGETLAHLAHELKINKHVRLGAGEQKSGGAQRESILADAMEAIIAAIYQDSDFEQCRNEVLKWYDERLKKNLLHKDHNLKDPKTQLQEHLQAKKYALPHYTVIKVEGEAHAQVFHVECKVPGIVHLSIGTGKSRRKAEQEAAQLFLAQLSLEKIINEE